MSSRLQWLDPNGDATSVTVMVHGLNLHPDRMQSLAHSLTAMGSQVGMVSLTGHLPEEGEALKRVSRAVWLSDVSHGFQIAAARAKKLRVPLFFVGYSIGSTLGQDLFNTPEASEFRPTRQVLLAPALALRTTSHLVRAFKIFGSEFVVPSLSYGSYHAHRGTPVAAYQALFDSRDAVLGTKMAASNLPTLVIMDPRDELISMSGLKQLIQDFGLFQWELLAVRQSGSLPLPYRHLIVDEFSLGKEAWLAINRAIHSHLFKNL